VPTLRPVSISSDHSVHASRFAITLYGDGGAREKLIALETIYGINCHFCGRPDESNLGAAYIIEAHKPARP
jgi:hypothetical protein